MKEQKPASLDIIELDGRWAQYGGDSGHVYYLDTGEFGFVDLGQYELKTYIERSVEYVIREGLGEFTSQELENIRWGPEQEEYPHLKMLVRVFGKYVKN
jgi:hypothetical protein